MRRRSLAFAATFLCALLAAPAASAQDVQVDPDSPAGVEYSDIPLEKERKRSSRGKDSRRESRDDGESGGGGTSSGSGGSGSSRGSAPAFGEGISRSDSKSRRSRKRSAEGSTVSGTERAGEPGPLQEASSSDDGGGSGRTLFLILLAIALLGGALGLLLRGEKLPDLRAVARRLRPGSD